MLVEEIGRHVAIANRVAAEDLASGDSGFWHVVSLRDPGSPPFPQNSGVVTLHSEVFRDIEDDSEPFSVRKTHIERIFRYVDERDLFDPLLIHCGQGLSRSPAVALAIISRSLRLDGEEEAVPTAIEIVLRLRDVASPNLLVTRLAFECFLSEDEAADACRLVKEDPRFAGNRFLR